MEHFLDIFNISIKLTLLYTFRSFLCVFLNKNTSFKAQKYIMFSFLYGLLISLSEVGFQL